LKLYTTVISIKINKNHIIAAIIAHFNAVSHKVGEIFSSLDRIKGAGKAHSFKSFTNVLASV
jgi:hypothetical protein